MSKQKQTTKKQMPEMPQKLIKKPSRKAPQTMLRRMADVYKQKSSHSMNPSEPLYLAKAPLPEPLPQQLSIDPTKYKLSRRRGFITDPEGKMFEFGKRYPQFGRQTLNYASKTMLDNDISLSDMEVKALCGHLYGDENFLADRLSKELLNHDRSEK